MDDPDRRMRVQLRQVLRLLRRDESGQSLIVVVSAMTVLLGIAGFGIDAASWMVRHHNAQVVADSAALAAAQCLANPNQANTNSIVVSGNVTSVPKCTSATDTADAQQVAVDYAAANGVTISAANVSVDTTNDVVKVSASTNTPGIFSRVMGIGATSQTARAGAGWKANANQCSSPGGPNCDFMFAHDENCAGGVNAGINLQLNGNSNVAGNIQSNGNLTVASNGNPGMGYGSYGPSINGNCQSIDQYNGHNPWSATPTQDTVNYPYPVDYSQDFPACGTGTGQTPCAANGYPTFCTNEGANITLNGSTTGDTTITNQIYCAAGTGTKSDPSTWNGSITISLNGSDTLYDTFVGGSMTFTGNGKDVLSSCGYAVAGYDSGTCNSSVAPTTTNYPIFYATGTSSTAVDIQVNGSQTMNGDVFVPNGGVSLQMNGNKSLTSFIEANDISGQISGTFQGDGPSAGGTGGNTGGSVSLVQ